MPTAYGTLDEYIKKMGESLAESKTKDTANQEALFSNQLNSTNSLYDTKVNEAKGAYEDKYRENAIQKLINERRVAENMANLGLTNSGLNRTQQTAVQLSYANNKASIDKQRQSQIDNLNLARTQDLNTIEQNRLASLADIENQYTQLATKYGTEAYNADVEAENERLLAEMDAETERQKNYLSYLSESAKSSNATPKLTKLAYGTMAATKNASNGNVTYTDSSGNSVTMRMGANPYTGKVHKDVLGKDGKYDPSKVFSNGYQPNNINGDKLTAYKPSKKSDETSKSTVPWRDDGAEQQIFTTGNNKYYAWYGPKNRYVQARWNSSKKCWDFNIG